MEQELLALPEHPSSLSFILFLLAIVLSVFRYTLWYLETFYRDLLIVDIVHYKVYI